MSSSLSIPIHHPPPIPAPRPHTPQVEYTKNHPQSCKGPQHPIHPRFSTSRTTLLPSVPTGLLLPLVPTIPKSSAVTSSSWLRLRSHALMSVPSLSAGHTPITGKPSTLVKLWKLTSRCVQVWQYGTSATLQIRYLTHVATKCALPVRPFLYNSLHSQPEHTHPHPKHLWQRELLARSCIPVQ